MVLVVILAATLARDNLEVAAGFLFGWILLLLTVADLRYRVLPDILTAMLLASGLLAVALPSSPSFIGALSGAVLGGGSFLTLRFVYFRYRGVEGLGLGDVKLMFALGAWVGPAGLPLLVLIAASAGLLLTGLQAWPGRRSISAASRIPFGAYLCGSALLLRCLDATGGWFW